MKRILFTGDSITDAGRNRETEFLSGSSYATMAAGILNFENPGQYEVLNRGISGNRIVDLAARIKSDLTNLKPDYLSILIGVNDAWHEIWFQNGVDADKFERDYDLFIGDVKEALPDVKIMILEPFVLQGFNTVDCEQFPNRWEFFSREVPLRAAAARRVAEKHGVTFIPLQEKFDEACKLAEPSFWLVDGVHPTAAGNELIKREWLKGFQTL